MLRKFFFLFLITILFSTVKAEVGVAAGARAGFNIAHLRKFSAPEFYKKRIVLGSDIAAMLRIDFNKYISLQTEIEFTQKGQAWKRSEDSARYLSKFVANYIQFPILAAARVGTEKYKATFYFGPYFAYWAGGYNQSSVSVDKQSRDASTNKYIFTKDDNRFDVGLVTGIGGDFKLGKGWLQVSARHNLGFMSMAKKNTTLPNLYNCNFSLTLGYLYTIK